MITESTMNRRTFIKRSGLGLALASVPSLLPTRLWAAASAAPGAGFNIALVGCGARGALILKEAVALGAHVIALCDADASKIDDMRQRFSEGTPEAVRMMEQAVAYEDYRLLIEKEKTLDGVLISIGPWWHAPMCTAFIKAGRHVYCEKPLTRLVSEARALGKLAAESNVTTQMGTQGTAGDTFRKAVEIVQAGLLGQITEVHAWNVAHELRPESQNRPEGQDPVPDGLNWDLWLGPAQERPFKRNVYLPGCMRTGMWLDFGTGLIGDFGTHTWQLPIRALKLGYPVRVDHNVPEPVKETYVSNAKIRYDFAARGDLAPVTGWYYDTVNRPPTEIVSELEGTFGSFPRVGAMLVGEKGWMHTGGWGGGNYIKLKDDPKFRGVNYHSAAKPLPMTEPRATGQNHMREWIEAAKSGAKAYQSFEVATHAMEVILPAIVSLRMQRPIDWDGANMRVPGAPEADAFIQADDRNKWLL